MNMRFQYNPEISLGNILQIITILASVAAAYGSLREADIKHDLIDQALAADIVEIKSTAEKVTNELKVDIKEVKKGVDGINDKLTGILIDHASRDNRRRVQ